MGWKNKDGTPCKTLPAIPPDDYEGTIADWIVALIERGYTSSEANEYYDIELNVDVYDNLLDECEAK